MWRENAFASNPHRARVFSLLQTYPQGRFCAEDLGSLYCCQLFKNAPLLRHFLILFSTESFLGKANVAQYQICVFFHLRKTRGLFFKSSPFCRDVDFATTGDY